MIFKKWETTVTCGNLPVSLIIKIRNETLHDHKHTTKPISTCSAFLPVVYIRVIS